MAKREKTAIGDLRYDPQNRRRHGDRNIQMISDAIAAVGTARSIVIDEDDVILAGEGVTRAAKAAGITKVRVIDASGDELIAVRRSDLTPEQKRALAIYDNRAGELSEWNDAQLEADRAAGLTLQPFWTPEEEAEMASRASARAIDEMARQAGPESTDDTDAPTATEETHTFFCSLTTDQERIVRAVLRAARVRYQLQTTGDALTAALQAWADAQKESDAA